MSFENAEDDFGYCEVFLDLDDTDCVDSISEDATAAFDAFDAADELLNNI